jgi:RNA polymerase primary sigma factor
MTNRRCSIEYDELAPYLEALREFPPLSREDEHALAVRARGGDPEARQRLVRHNLAFAVAVARRQRRGSVRLDDLIQEGNVGLMRAVERFDPHAGTRFCTYAVWWIRAYIGKYLKEARSAVRPQSGTVAQPDLSLDEVHDEEGGRSLVDILEDGAPGPEERYLAAERDRELRATVGKVRRRIGKVGWDIVYSRLGEDQPQTLDAIGKRWGVSRERVRQIEFRTKQVLWRHLSPIEHDDIARDAA